MKQILFALFLTLPMLAFGQTLTGKVSTTDGQPLRGVKIVAEGTTQGTVTDAMGAYTLKVPNGAAVTAVTFTAREYKKPLKVKLDNGMMGDTQIHVTMDKKKKKRKFVVSSK